MNFIQRLTQWYFTCKALPYWVILLLDCAIVIFCGYFAAYLQTGGQYFVHNIMIITNGIVVALAFYIIAFRQFHTYSGILRYSSFSDLQKVFSATFTGSVLEFVFALICNYFECTKLFVPDLLHGLIAFALLTLLMWLMRLGVRATYEGYKESGRSKKVFVYGIKSGGLGIARSLSEQEPRKYTLAGFISPDGDLNDKWLMGVKVRRVGPNLINHIKDADASTILVSPLESERFSNKTELIDSLIDAGIKILMLPPEVEWDGKSTLSYNQLHEVEIEDLLPRDKIEIDMDAIGTLLTDKCILITGAAGSIGSEMVRQVAIYRPSKLILVDQAETPMHDVRLMMQRKHLDIKCETIVASITDAEHMEALFSRHRPEYVFHAAAYKHVPMMEDNPGQAVRNNIRGTRIIADLAVKYGTKKFVMISTDKAVNPSNVMGCSKRICEIYCQSLNATIQKGICPIKYIPIEGESEAMPHTQFVTTRFGNVLGSNGSVIPIFKKQIQKGGPITVTHPDIIRYFMLIPEACKLVLEAGTMGKGGEIFVFDMGKPVKIANLAKRMIALSGAKNIDIQYTGLRDGEKLYEELLATKENTKPTHHPKIMVASVREYDYEIACANEERLLEASKSFDDMTIVSIMKDIVPEFKSQVSKYQELDKN